MVLHFMCEIETALFFFFSWLDFMKFAFHLFPRLSLSETPFRLFHLFDLVYLILIYAPRQLPNNRSGLTWIQPTMTTDHVSKPTEADALILEAWGQGLMVGSLLIMAAITLSNMKSHILLHKLIFAEVRKSKDYLTQSFIRWIELRLIFALTIAHPGYGPWYFHLPPRASLWLVSIRNCDRSQHLLGPP